MTNQPENFSSLLDWCERYDHQIEPVTDVIDLEKLFLLRCEKFLDSRSREGFSKTSYCPKVQPKLSIVINSCFGAKAYISGGVDTVEINSGTLMFFLWAGLKIVMDPAFPFAGSPELSPRAKRSEGQNTSSLRTFDIPRCPARRAIGIEFAFLCFAFVVFHEVGHLAQGHCALLGTTFHDYDSRAENEELTHLSSSDDETEEFNRESPQLDAECRRTLEFMADQFAARDLLIFIKSVRNELFPEESMTNPFGKLSVNDAIHVAISESVEKRPSLTAIGQATHFCYADSLFAPVIPYVVFAIVFHFTSSTSRYHPDADLRLLASLRASHQLIPTVWKVDVSKEMFEMGIALQNIAGQALTAGVLNSNGVWSGFDSGQTSTFDRVDRDINRMHNLRKELEPLLGKFAQGRKAFLRYAETSL